MAPKMAIRSVRMPAGPVTLTWRPPTSVAPSRIDSVITARASSPLGVFSPALSALSGTLMSSAWPSWDGIGTIGPGSRKSATVASSTGSPGIDSAKAPAAARSSGVRAAPSGRVSTMRTGSEEPSEKAACSFATRVDSADAGRNDALSLEETSLSLPDRGPATPPMSSQPMATATAIHTALRPERLRVTGRASVPVLMPTVCRKGRRARQPGVRSGKVIDSSTTTERHWSR